MPADVLKHCSVCRCETDEEFVKKQYLEKPDVFLERVRTFRCANGHSTYIIPQPHKLLRKVVTHFTTKVVRLSAQEITFLREQLRWSIEELAQNIGVSITRAIDWETGERIISIPADRLLRVCVATRRNIPIPVLRLGEVGKNIEIPTRPLVLSYNYGNWRVTP